MATDLTTKAWARQLSTPATSRVIGRRWLRVVLNRGASFGIGADSPIVVETLAGVATLVLLVVLLRSTRPTLALPLAAALGGALGNVTDRAVHGSVMDWIHVPWYPPSFNVADLAVRGGLASAVVIWAWHLTRAGARDHTARRQSRDATRLRPSRLWARTR